MSSVFAIARVVMDAAHTQEHTCAGVGLARSNNKHTCILAGIEAFRSNFCSAGRHSHMVLLVGIVATARVEAKEVAFVVVFVTFVTIGALLF